MADACGILASYSCLYMAVMRPTRWLITGLKEHQSGEGGVENHLYWIDFYEHHTDESGDENKDGDIELLEECLASELNEREIYWIAFYNSTDNKCGYNMSLGGNVNRKPT